MILITYQDEGIHDINRGENIIGKLSNETNENGKRNITCGKIRRTTSFFARELM